MVEDNVVQCTVNEQWGMTAMATQSLLMGTRWCES